MGLYANVMITGDTDVSGTLGDATFDGVIDLTWAGDFANNGDTFINSATMSRIERRD